MPEIQKMSMILCKAMDVLVGLQGQMPISIGVKKVLKDGTSIKVSIETTRKVKGDFSFSALDRAVMDCIYTLMLHGHTAFTSATIVRLLSGNVVRSCSEGQKGRVEEILDRLSGWQITVDATDEMLKRKVIKPGCTYVLKGQFLPISRRPAEKGLEYTLTEKPVIYQYAEDCHQITDVPITLLQARTAGGQYERQYNTPEDLVIKRYLLQRIETMRNPRNRVSSRKISYLREEFGKRKGLLPAIGVQIDRLTGVSYRKRKAQIHTTVIRILEEFVRQGYIEGYGVTYDGKQKVSGVLIDLLSEEPS